MDDAKYALSKGNTFELIKTLDDNSVDLLITSPPYNIGKVYEKRTDFASYLKPYVEFAKHIYTKLAPTGSLCWEVGNYVQSGEVFPLDIYFYDIFKDAGFKLRNRIIWHFEHGLHASRRFSGRYETILWFTKSVWVTHLVTGRRYQHRSRYGEANAAVRRRRSWKLRRRCSALACARI
jgi:adenine-specific DNA-methyltransferase